MDHYSQLNIIQKIAFKGMIKHRSERPYFFTDAEHKYFDGLYALWIVSSFKDAINTFFIG